MEQIKHAIDEKSLPLRAIIPLLPDQRRSTLFDECVLSVLSPLVPLTMQKLRKKPSQSLCFMCTQSAHRSDRFFECRAWRQPLQRRPALQLPQPRLPSVLVALQALLRPLPLLPRMQARAFYDPFQEAFA